MEPHPRRRVAQRGGRSGWAQKAHLQGGLGSEKWGLRVGTGVGGQARISPSWGEEGSVVAELSLRAELLCSSGRLRTELSGTPLPSRCRFLFFTRMRPIRSWGLGRGTPGASWWAWTGQRLLGALTPTPCPSSEPHTGYLSRGSMSRASPKMERQYSAILACCFALWGQGQRSEVPGVKLKSPEWIRGWQDDQKGHSLPGSKVIGAIQQCHGEWLSLGQQGLPPAGIGAPLTSPRGSQRRG